MKPQPLVNSSPTEMTKPKKNMGSCHGNMTGCWQWRALSGVILQPVWACLFFPCAHAYVTEDSGCNKPKFQSSICHKHHDRRMDPLRSRRWDGHYPVVWIPQVVFGFKCVPPFSVCVFVRVLMNFVEIISQEFVLFQSLYRQPWSAQLLLISFTRSVTNFNTLNTLLTKQLLCCFLFTRWTRYGVMTM